MMRNNRYHLLFNSQAQLEPARNFFPPISLLETRHVNYYTMRKKL